VTKRHRGEAAAKRPHVWLVNLFFGAGPAPTGVLLESVAAELHRRGWRVEVVTGRTRYNTGAAAAARRFAGAVHRLYCGPAQARGLLGRLLSWAGFYLAVAWFAFTRRPPDKVLILTTPPFLHALFVLRNLLAHRKAELTLWNQDTYPEVLAAVGLLRPSSLLYRALLALQGWGASRVARAIVLDGAMQERLRGHGAGDVRIVPNWEAEGNAAPSAGRQVGVPADAALVERLRRLRESYRYLVLYTGNYGWGHNLEVVWEYLRREPRQRVFAFAFVGGGEKWPLLGRLRQEYKLECLEVADYVPREQVAALLREADFGLVALERTCLGLMSPSKIHGYLACGKPLLYVGPPGSNVAEALDGYRCGLRVEENDLAGWYDCVSAVSADTFDYAALSRNALAASGRHREDVGVSAVLDCLGEAGVARLPGGEG
jgi:hypothetical protein